MQKLKEIQNYFFLSIFKQNHVNLNFIYSSNPSERLNIYRQTIYENMRSALEITFPGTWSLLGKECANGAAFSFCENIDNLPASGCLDDFGEKFPEFLGKQDKFSTLLYLKDYALFEWYKQMSYKQESGSSFDQSELEIISEDRVSEIQLILIPSLYTLSSDHALHEIQAVLDNPTLDSINLSDDRAYAIIARPHEEVLVLWVPKSLWIFINSLSERKSLKEAIEIVINENSDFSMVEAMHFLLKNNLIEKINYSSEVNHDGSKQYSKETIIHLLDSI